MTPTPDIRPERIALFGPADTLIELLSMLNRWLRDDPVTPTAIVLDVETDGRPRISVMIGFRAMKPLVPLRFEGASGSRDLAQQNFNDLLARRELGSLPSPLDYASSQGRHYLMACMQDIVATPDDLPEVKEREAEHSVADEAVDMAPAEA